MADAIFWLTVAVSMLLGLFIFYAPQKTFDIQKSFYRRINWNIEPISLKKEIRNTKIMGVFLVIFTLMACLFVIYRSP